jgi:hypothetical protein
MVAYAIPPSILVDAWEQPWTNTANSPFKQIDGGVAEASLDGVVNPLGQTRPFRYIAKNTAQYQLLRDFLRSLGGKSLLIDGKYWIVTDKTWTPIGFTVWQLNMNLLQTFN